MTDDGYRTGGQLELGPIAKAAAAPPMGQFTDPVSDLAANCPGFDSNTDGVMPASIRLTNQTAGFSAKLSNTSYKAAPQGSSGVSPDVLVMRAYSSGIDCSELVTASGAFFSNGEGWGLSFDEPTAPAATSGPHVGYVIVRNYFTPANPSGNQSLLGQTGLALAGAMRNDHATLVSLDGPGAIRDGGPGSGGGFYFSALSEPTTMAGTAATVEGTGTTVTPIPFSFGDGNCPAADGTSIRQSTFSQAFEQCIDPAKTYTATFDTSMGTIMNRVYHNFPHSSAYKYVNSFH
ncbi:MAG: hypothetical protein QM733_24490 [Ilumatobacteraceae bacterium]